MFYLVVMISQLQFKIRPYYPCLKGETWLELLIRELERRLIVKVLGKTGGNRTHASRILEISHRTLLYKIEEYGIEA